MSSAHFSLETQTFYELLSLFLLWGGDPKNRFPTFQNSGKSRIVIASHLQSHEDKSTQGIIEDERRDSFNVPIFYHSVEDVRAVAESLSEAFHIKRLEIKHQSYFEQDEVEQMLADPEAYGRFSKNFIRSLLNSYVVEHIGEEKSHKFFERLEQNAATAAREKRMSSLTVDCVLAVLIRKA